MKRALLVKRVAGNFPLLGMTMTKQIMYLLVALLVTMVCGENVTAAQNGETCTIRIPAQPLAESLKDFAEQTGTDIAFFSDVVGDRATRALNGEYAVYEALEILLRDSGLTYRQVGDSVIAVYEAASVNDQQPLHGGKTMAIEEETVAAAAAPKPSLLKRIATAVVTALLALPASAENTNTAEEAEAGEEFIEEIVVTGTHIRRTAFDTASPKHVVDQLDIQLSGNAEIGDVIFDQSFQFGVNANTATYEALEMGGGFGPGAGADGNTGALADNQQANQGTEVWANIRGLGTRATMTMLDGHRLPMQTNQFGDRVGVDTSGLYPMIAIDRIETLLDGAGAIYGVEAVAGVINMIPRKNFEGVEISYDVWSPLEDGAPNQALQLLGGVQGDRGRAIVALEVREADRMRMTDRPQMLIDTRSPFFSSGANDNEFYPRTLWNKEGHHSLGNGSNPGNYIAVPIRDLNGELYSPSGRSAADPTLGNNTRQAGLGWADLLGPIAVGSKLDPGCGFAFASGHSVNGPDVKGGPGLIQDWAGWAGLGTAHRDDWIAQHGPIEPGQFRHKEGVTFAHTDIGKHGNWLNGVINEWDLEESGDRRCSMVDSDIKDIQAEMERRKGMAYFEYELSDQLMVRAEIVAGTLDTNTRMVAPDFSGFSNSSGDFVHDQMAIVVGHNAGNPFRAFADGSSHLGWDASNNNRFLYPGTDEVHDLVEMLMTSQLDFDDVNGNGRYEYGVEPGELLVFAQDANDDGVPDRDADGDGVADSGVQGNPIGRVILMGMDDADGDGLADRFDPDAGGIAFNEDVRLPDQGWRAFSKHPRNNNLPWAHNEGGVMGFLRRTKRTDLRLRIGATFEVPDSDWTVDADWVWAQGIRETNVPRDVTPALIDALRCNGGDGQDSCWNPFGTTYLAMDENGFLIGDPSVKFPSANDPGLTPADDPAVNTEAENRTAGIVMGFETQEVTMNSVDVVASTARLFDLWYNDTPVGFAFGGHWRRETDEFRPHLFNQAALNEHIRARGNIALRESETDTWALLAELILQPLNDSPVGDLEVQLAARYFESESQGVIGQPGISKFDEIIPKLAIRYAPTDWLALRGSYTEGFVPPSLRAQFGEASVTSIANVGDYICENMPDLQDCIDGGASASQPGVRVRNAGNPALAGETSELYNLGLSLRFLDGNLALDADYTHVEFRGMADLLSATQHVAFNANGFADFVLSGCPGTILNWQTPSLNPEGLTAEEWQASEFTSPADQACRRDAAIAWIETGANNGIGERPYGDATLIRGRDVQSKFSFPGGGLAPGGVEFGETYNSPILLDTVDEPWSAQGLRKVETITYGARYHFRLPEITWTERIGGDFTLSADVTQFLTQEVTVFKSFGCVAEDRNDGGFCNIDSLYADLAVDGVGNRNSLLGVPGSGLFYVLPPTPEFRVNANLRWQKGPHTAQLAVRWHDSVSVVNAAWDEMIARDEVDPRDVLPDWTHNLGSARGPTYLPAVTDASDIAERDRCSHSGAQGWPICKIDSRAYWDVAYNYQATDLFGISRVSVNVTIRNVFDEFPDAIAEASGHDVYLDDIMGRTMLVRLNLGL